MVLSKSTSRAAVAGVRAAGGGALEDLVGGVEGGGGGGVCSLGPGILFKRCREEKERVGNPAGEEMLSFSLRRKLVDKVVLGPTFLEELGLSLMNVEALKL